VTSLNRIDIGGKRVYLRTSYDAPLRVGLNTLRIRFVRVGRFERFVGLLAALYVLVHPAPPDKETTP
jgi:hypothetical protein